MYTLSIKDAPRRANVGANRSSNPVSYSYTARVGFVKCRCPFSGRNGLAVYLPDSSPTDGRGSLGATALPKGIHRPGQTPHKKTVRRGAGTATVGTRSAGGGHPRPRWVTQGRSSDTCAIGKRQLQNPTTMLMIVSAGFQGRVARGAGAVWPTDNRAAHIKADRLYPSPTSKAKASITTPEKPNS